jgi:hypothetical protein
MEPIKLISFNQEIILPFNIKGYQVSAPIWIYALVAFLLGVFIS